MLRSPGGSMADSLDALMESLGKRATGASAGKRRFIANVDGVPVSVTLMDRDGESHVRYVLLSTAYPTAEGASLAAVRPMDVTLRIESAGDAQDKKKGVVVELQTGDATFDDKVFVDTQTEDSVMRSVLNEKARDAVRRLFASRKPLVSIDSSGTLELSGTQIDVTGGTIAALFFEGLGEKSKIEDPGQHVLDAMRDLAKAVPPIRAAQGAKKAVAGGIRQMLFLAMAVASFVVSAINLYEHPRGMTALASAAGAAVVGGLLSFPLTPLVFYDVRGTSNAGAIRSRGTFALSAMLAGIASAIALLYLRN
jgi:hypothetical protein